MALIVTRRGSLSAGVFLIVALAMTALALTACASSPAGDRPTLIYFRVSNCPYCKQMTPVVSELAADYGKQLDLVYAEVDEQDGKDLARQHGIIGYPTILLLDSDGERAGLLRGVVPLSSLKKVVDDVLEEQ